MYSLHDALWFACEHTARTLFPYQNVCFGRWIIRNVLLWSKRFFVRLTLDGHYARLFPVPTFETVTSEENWLCPILTFNVAYNSVHVTYRNTTTPCQRTRGTATQPHLPRVTPVLTKWTETLHSLSRAVTFHFQRTDLCVHFQSFDYSVERLATVMCCGI